MRDLTGITDATRLPVRGTTDEAHRAALAVDTHVAHARNHQ